MVQKSEKTRKFEEETKSEERKFCKGQQVRKLCSIRNKWAESCESCNLKWYVDSSQSGWPQQAARAPQASAYVTSFFSFFSFSRYDVSHTSRTHHDRPLVNRKRKKKAPRTGRVGRQDDTKKEQSRHTQQPNNNKNDKENQHRIRIGQAPMELSRLCIPPFPGCVSFAVWCAGLAASICLQAGGKSFQHPKLGALSGLKRKRNQKATGNAVHNGANKKHISKVLSSNNSRHSMCTTCRISHWIRFIPWAVGSGKSRPHTGDRTLSTYENDLHSHKCRIVYQRTPYLIRFEERCFCLICPTSVSSKEANTSVEVWT